MNIDNDIYISPLFSRDDYIALGLCDSSSEDVWLKAIEMFKDRMLGRYIDQISFLSNDIPKNGFVIMALNCLLVETFFQFHYGCDETPRDNKRNNKHYYTRFLKRCFPNTFDTQLKAEIFYHDIRCGILHSAQTKHNTRLTCTDEYVIDLDCNRDSYIFSISVNGFTDLLIDYFFDYCCKLENPTEYILRSCFKQKMDYLCRINMN